MKKLLLVVGLFAFVGFSNAQSKEIRRNSNQVEKVTNLERMGKELNLTEAQMDEIKTINQRFVKEREAIRSTGTRADFHKIKEAEQKEIEKVLTPEQLDKKNAQAEKKKEERRVKSGEKSNWGDKKVRSGNKNKSSLKSNN